jgi:hypothetical protein
MNMSLTWHIIRKDLRRLWLPLTLWLVLLLAYTALLWVRVGSNVTRDSFEGLVYFSNTWGVIVWLVGAILAAWLVMEDSLVDTQAFWLTRPVSHARLFAAKVIGALLMFSVLPALVLTPVWLWSGFSLREWLWAAAEIAGVQAEFSLAAFVIASVTATSGQFLVRAVGAVLLVPYTFYTMGRMRVPVGGEAELVDSWHFLVVGIVAVTLLLLVVHQFLTRNTTRSWMIFGTGVLLMLAVRLAWPWVIPTGIRDFGQAVGYPAEGPADEALKFQLGRVTVEPRRPESPVTSVTLHGTMTGAAPGTFVRLNWLGGPWQRAGEDNSADRITEAHDALVYPPPQTLRQVAGLPGDRATPLEWVVVGKPWNRLVEQTEPKRVDWETEVRATVMTGRLLGELPLRRGAVLRTGSSFTRVADIEWREGRIAVRLEERDAWPTGLLGSYRGAYYQNAPRLRPAADAFVIVNRSLGFEALPQVAEIGTLWASALVAGQRELIFDPPTREINGATREVPGWEEGAMIVKVRFLPDHRFSRARETFSFQLQPQ